VPNVQLGASQGAKCQGRMLMPQNRHKAGFPGPGPSVGKATQFQPGQSGNPGGRPKKRPYQEAHELIATLTLEQLGITETEFKRLDLKKTDEVAYALAKAVVKEALAGKIDAAKEAANRTEGTPAMRIEHIGEDDHPVHLRVSFVGGNGRVSSRQFIDVKV
jgi:Family of unknown function (DUF5681)